MSQTNQTKSGLFFKLDFGPNPWIASHVYKWCQCRLCFWVQAVPFMPLSTNCSKVCTSIPISQLIVPQPPSMTEGFSACSLLCPSRRGTNTFLTGMFERPATYFSVLQLWAAPLYSLWIKLWKNSINQLQWSRFTLHSVWFEHASFYHLSRANTPFTKNMLRIFDSTLCVFPAGWMWWEVFCHSLLLFTDRYITHCSLILKIGETTTWVFSLVVHLRPQLRLHFKMIKVLCWLFFHPRPDRLNLCKQGSCVSLNLHKAPALPGGVISAKVMAV